MLLNSSQDVLPDYPKLPFLGYRQPDKGLINGIDLNLRLQLSEDVHYPLRHITVQGVVGGEDFDLVAVDQGLAAEIWLTHLDTQRLGFVGSGDDAAIVIGEHHYRLSLKLRLENPFTGDIEVVAVNQGKEGWHSEGLERMDDEGNHSPDFAGGAFGHMDVGVVGILSLQIEALAIPEQSFHCQLTVDHRDHHFAVDRFQRTVNHQNVVVVDTGPDHGVTGYPDKKGSGWVGYHEFIEIEPSFDVVLCRTWKSGRDATGKKGTFQFTLTVEGING